MNIGVNVEETRLPRTRGSSGHLALVAVATSAAAVPLTALFATPVRVMPVFACAALVGTVPGWVSFIRRWTKRTRLAVLVVIVAGLAGTSVLAYRNRTSVYDLAIGWLNSPANLLTANLPRDSTPSELAFLTSVIVFTAVAAAVLTVRTVSSVTPLAPMIALFCGGIAVTASTPFTHVTGAVGLVATALVFVITRSVARTTASTSTTGSRSRKLQRMSGRLLLPLAVLATLLVTVAVWRPFTGDGSRADPRSLIKGGLDVQARISPLSKIKTQLRTSPPVPLFDVTPTRKTPLGDRIRVAALDAYDGVMWTSAFPFAAAGHHFFPEPGVSTASTVSARISIRQLDGMFLPVLGHPTRLADVAPSGRRLGFSPASDTIVDLDGLHPGFTYEVTGDIPDRNAALAPQQQPIPADLRPYVELPLDVPVEMRLLSERLTSTRNDPLAKLTAIEAHLRALPYRVDVPAGHTYANILSLLGTSDKPPLGGYAEQRAAAFAVLARLAAIPTRIAVGYRLTGEPTPFQVTTRHAHAWPESYFPGHGWIAFEPTPEGDPPPDQPLPPKVGALPQPPPPAPRPSPVEQPQPPRPPIEPAEPVDNRVWQPLLVTSLALVGLVGVALGQKLSRRWRRRRTGPNTDRIRGAWREAMDRLAENGYREQASDTPHETVERAAKAHSAAGGPLSALAALVTTATCSPSPPDDDLVTRAWRHERDLRRALARGRLMPFGAIRVVFDPRPLWRIPARDRRKGHRDT